MIKCRYQYYSKEGIKWTDWFISHTNQSIEDLKKKKPAIKKLKEEYIEC